MLTKVFQSPSHRGPRARLANAIDQMLGGGERFSPLLIGGRARGDYPANPYRRVLVSFSPLLIGGRARGPIQHHGELQQRHSFSPLLIGGRARGSNSRKASADSASKFQSPSHRGPRARHVEVASGAGQG